MITMKELLGNHSVDELTRDQLLNMKTLLDRVNQLRSEWGKPITITSGFRNHEDMRRIYKSDVYPKLSKHLFGQACDMKDDGSLMAWLKEDDSARMKKFGLWGELGTNGWVHIQIVSMKSYNVKTDLRWFKP